MNWKKTTENDPEANFLQSPEWCAVPDFEHFYQRNHTFPDLCLPR